MALDFFAGCLGGAAGVLVGHPFDTVKVRLQTQCAVKPLYRGTFHCFASIIKQETPLGLYKGMASPMYSLMAINAIVFGVQGNVQRRMSNPDLLSSHFISGAIAGTCQSVICSPMELAKTRMQTQGQGERKLAHARYTGPADCLRQLFRAKGIRGVYRGMGLTVAREAPSFGSYFLCYEYLCRAFENEDGTLLSTPILLLAGGSAGMCSWFFTYPIDVVKSRVQNDHAGIYKNALDCALQSFASGGYRSFTRGLGATMIRAFPVNAATFTTVAWVLRLCETRDKHAHSGEIAISELPILQHHKHIEGHKVDIPLAHS